MNAHPFALLALMVAPAIVAGDSCLTNVCCSRHIGPGSGYYPFDSYAEYKFFEDYEHCAGSCGWYGNSQEECDSLYPNQDQYKWVFDQCDLDTCGCVSEGPILAKSLVSCCLYQGNLDPYSCKGHCAPYEDQFGNTISYFEFDDIYIDPFNPRGPPVCPLQATLPNYDALIAAGYTEQRGLCRTEDSGVCGEPHIQLWNGTWFDYHGECTLVFLKAPSFANGLGLEIHIRTKIRYEYSFIETAVIKIGNDILEVSSWGQYWLNSVESATLPATLGERTITYTQVDQKEHHFVIPTYGAVGGTREHILISTFKDFVSVYIKNGTHQSFADSVGIMGQFGNGAMLDRNGEPLDHDPIAFGQAWQVLDTESMLFQNVIGPQYPSTCILPDVTSKSRRLGESVAQHAAEEACAHLSTDQEQKNCVYDVMATGDMEMARPRAM